MESREEHCAAGSDTIQSVTGTRHLYCDNPSSESSSSACMSVVQKESHRTVTERNSRGREEQQGQLTTMDWHLVIACAARSTKSAGVRSPGTPNIPGVCSQRTGPPRSTHSPRPEALKAAYIVTAVVEFVLRAKTIVVQVVVLYRELLLGPGSQ